MKKFRICKTDSETEQGKRKADGIQTETKTVSVKIPGDLYAQLVSIKDAGGYKSVYEILQLLIVCFTRHVERARQAQSEQPPEPPDPMAEEIAAMFADLADSEPKPEEGAKPIAHKPRKGFLNK